MDQKRVRNSAACEVCRKRRGKCSGSAPCTYCTEHSQLCVFSALVKKRGPASKKQKEQYNFTEGAFVLPKTPDAEFKYMGEYLNHFFFLPPINQDGVHNPTTPAHHMMRFVLLSHMSRSFGAITRSEEFISTARQISGLLYDEPSYDSGVAFMLLADICLANSDPRAYHYASVAWNHAKMLSRNDWSHIHLQLQSFVMSNMLDTSLSPEQKQQQLFTYASQLLDADILSTIISGLMLKTGAVGLVLNGTSCKEAGLLYCLKNLTVTYSTAETMKDLDKLEHYVQNTPPIQKWVLLLFAKLFRTMLLIKLGNFSEASQAARDMVEISNRPEIKHIVKNELFLPVIMPNLASLGSLGKVVVELYHFTQQLEKQSLSPNDGPNAKIPPTYSVKQENMNPFFSYFPTQPLSYLPTLTNNTTSTISYTPTTNTPFPPQSTIMPPPQHPHTTYSPSPNFFPTLISRQPDMKSPTLQPSLQNTFQNLFLQGMSPTTPFAPPFHSSTFLSSPSAPIPFPLPPQPPAPAPSLPVPTPSSVEEDYLWWQTSEKIDDLWTQAINGEVGPK